MSAPRPVEKGKTYLLTRRCSQRQFLLKPSAIVNQVFLYCLAVAADRFDMLIHAVCVLANHYHLVATDQEGRLPEFMHWLDMFVAKCLNAHYGRWESFWAPGSYSAVEAVEEGDILREVVYALNNPVKAGLVACGDDWPGVRSRPGDMYGTSLTVKRPEGFFSKNGTLPETATLKFALPPSASDADAFISDVTSVLSATEQSVRDSMASEGKRFLGVAAIKKLRHTNTPKSRERRRQLNPRIACRNRLLRIEALQRLRSFRSAYREAWLQFKEGVRDVLFPAGTYWVVRYAGANCAPA